MTIKEMTYFTIGVWVGIFGGVAFHERLHELWFWVAQNYPVSLLCFGIFGIFALIANLRYMLGD